MNHLKYIFFILYFLFSTILADDSALLDQASSYYKEAQYNDALQIYETLYTQFPNNIDILYNLGNAHFKLDNNGYAIGYYLKALQWNPSDSDIRYNLSLARNLVQQESTQASSILYNILGWLRFLSINVSFNIMLCCLLIFLTILRLIQLKKFNKELLTNILVIFGLCFVVSFSIFSYHYAQYTQEKGVVILKKVAVYSGPSETLSVLFYIHEGYEFIINKTAGDWVEIELSNGFKGWVPVSGLFLL